MTVIQIDVAGSKPTQMDVYTAVPQIPSSLPGVIVIYDALGMSHDARAQADWLAEAGFLAATPDLFLGRTFAGCMFRIMRDFMRGTGPMFERVEATRQWLLAHESCNGKIGVIGFCFGGAFALMLAPRGAYDAASVNYGSLGPGVADKLAESCPLVGSYGMADRNTRGTARQLTDILAAAGIDHDIKEYEGADHGFMNDHSADSAPFILHLMGAVFGGNDAFHAEATADARQRITAFFHRYLVE